VLLVDAFERVLATDPAHPGAIHLYIHAMELTHPARAEGAADVLAGLMPSAGHMVHMPSHIYMRVGRYDDAYAANRRASDADADYIAQCQAQGIYPLNYYPHNLHFMVWAAMFQGRSEVALAGAREVQEQIPHHMAGDFSSLEIFLAQPMYVMVRFGMWERALAEPAPDAQMRFMNGVWHYMRGTAYGATGNARAARKELAALVKLRGALPDDYLMGFATASRLLQIAELLLEGDIDARKGAWDDAIAKIARAARVEDSLLYSEPPDWYFPTRHVLGAVLLEAGYPAEAEAVFWQDLRKHPGNGYALYGLTEALKVQGKPDAARYQQAFLDSWAGADVSLTSSRY
jgi:tetratricopeptide (TPR) repeat protein